MIKTIEDGARCRPNYYCWQESTKHNSFDFYGVAYAIELGRTLDRTVSKFVRMLPPHELYQETSKIIPLVRGVGKERVAVVVKLVDRYRRDNPSHFCECGEPFLHWYKYCPTCGKRIGG